MSNVDAAPVPTRRPWLSAEIALPKSPFLPIRADARFSTSAGAVGTEAMNSSNFAYLAGDP